ncbi:MAG TPA: YbhB/YbcL family Raf kinase inhibitor-like protein [Pseudonocardiaceae bacterium]|nr:YbhB/YbcL family Raf kinase inhibitor-like protein [Pseudonocardiaceae bacterium]
MPLTLTSPAFAEGEFFPVQYTCDGDNISPPLEWSEVPDGAAELVLIFEDIDAPGGTQVYWALYGLNPANGGIEEGKVPVGAVGGKNDYGRTDWAGPCPPYGFDRPRRFSFTLLAISEPSGLREGASPRNDLPYALSGKVLAQAQLTGKYARRR